MPPNLKHGVNRRCVPHVRSDQTKGTLRTPYEDEYTMDIWGNRRRPAAVTSQGIDVNISAERSKCASVDHQIIMKQKDKQETAGAFHVAYNFIKCKL